MNEIAALLLMIDAAKRNNKQPEPDIFRRTLPTPLDRRLYFRELIIYLHSRGVGINRMKRIFNCHKDDIRKIMESIE